MSEADLTPTLPRNFLRPVIMLLLKESSAHGYDLLERAQALGFTRADPGGLYRTLRALEDEGLVRSAWERSEHGPNRRIYEITRAGAERLHHAAQELRAGAELLDSFVSRYEEFVALPRTQQGAETSCSA